MSERSRQAAEPTLWILGMPLEESQVPSPDALIILEKADLLIGESRKVAFSYLKHTRNFREKEIHFLDGMSQLDLQILKERIHRAKHENQSLALFSDVGMPIFFDPGVGILSFCKHENFRIRSLPSATSWGTAIAVSGFSPPFLIFDLLPRKSPERFKAFQNAKAAMVSAEATGVFLETPYRFRKFLDEACKFFPTAHAFLAWNISCASETFLWGSVKEISNIAKQQNMEKGEFVLLVTASKRNLK